MVLPRTAMRTLAVTEAIALYGGLAVFSGMILYDTQKVLLHARLAAEGRMKADPVSESISITLDIINLYVRMVRAPSCALVACPPVLADVVAPSLRRFRSSF